MFYKQGRAQCVCACVRCCALQPTMAAYMRRACVWKIYFCLLSWASKHLCMFCGCDVASWVEELNPPTVNKGSPRERARERESGIERERAAGQDPPRRPAADCSFIPLRVSISITKTKIKVLWPCCGMFPSVTQLRSRCAEGGRVSKHAAQQIGNRGTSTKRRRSAPRWLLWQADGGKTFPQWRKKKNGGGGGGGRGEEGQTHGRQVDKRRKKEVCFSHWRIISCLCALTTCRARNKASEILTWHKWERRRAAGVNGTTCERHRDRRQCQQSWF